MSFLTGTSAEVLYQSIATGTQLNTFTTEDNLMKTLPPCVIPPSFWSTPATGTGKCLKLRAVYRIGTTSTPTFTFTVRLLTSTTWSAGGVSWSTAAITAGSTVTLAPIQLDFDIICRSLGAAGANTTLAGIGLVSGGTGFAAAGSTFSIPAANTSFTNSIDASINQYLFLSVACGTSNALNLCQLEIMKCYGEN